MDDDTFSMQTVEVYKRPGQGLGLYLREGNGKDRVDGVFISRLAPGGAVATASPDGPPLRVGDEILTVNSVSAVGRRLEDVVISMSIPKKLILTVRRMLGSTTNGTNSSSSLSALASGDSAADEQMQPPVVVVKGAASAAYGEHGGAGMGSGRYRRRSPDRLQLGGDRRLYPRSASADFRRLEEIRDCHHQCSSCSSRQCANCSSHQCICTSATGTDDSGDSGLSSDNSGLYRLGTCDNHFNLLPTSQSHHSNCWCASPTPSDGVHEGTRSSLTPISWTQSHTLRSSDSSHRLGDHTFTEHPKNAGLSSNGEDTFNDTVYDNVPYYAGTPHRSNGDYCTIRRRDASLGNQRNVFSWDQSDFDKSRYRRGNQSVSSAGSRYSDSSVPPSSSSGGISREAEEDDLAFLLRQMNGISVDQQRRFYRKAVKTMTYENLESVSNCAQPRSYSMIEPTNTGSIYRPDGLPYSRSQPLYKGRQSNNNNNNNNNGSGNNRPETGSLLDYKNYILQQMTEVTSSETGLTNSDPTSSDSSSILLNSIMRPSRSSDRGEPGQKGSNIGGHNFPSTTTVDPFLTGTMDKSKLSIKKEAFRPYQRSSFWKDSDSSKTVGSGIDGVVCVHLFCAQKLTTLKSGNQRMYCVIEVDSVGSARTEIQAGSSNFDWDDRFVIDIQDARCLSFSIYNYVPRGRHGLCVHGDVSLAELIRADQGQTGGRRHHRLALALEPHGVLYLEVIYSDPYEVFTRNPSVHADAIFGTELEAMVRKEDDIAGRYSGRVPAMLVRCVEEVERRGMEQIKIYRVCGSDKLIRALRRELERESREMWKAHMNRISDINIVTGLLKDWMRELPEPLCTTALYPMFMDALSVQLPNDSVGNAQLMMSVVGCLPPIYLETLTFMLDHLKRITLKSHLNKMTSADLSLALGPAMFCPSSDLIGNRIADCPAWNFEKNSRLLKYLLDIWPENRGTVTPSKEV